jgi:heme-degrading monooxygenase HmoA
MIVVVFEVLLKSSEAQRYFDLAAELRGELATVPGFISVERFRSLNDPDKYVSLSFWEDEAAVARWRRREAHKLAQALGRHEIFADFRITVARSIRSYRLSEPSPHATEPAGAFP